LRCLCLPLYPPFPYTTLFRSRAPTLAASNEPSSHTYPITWLVTRTSPPGRHHVAAKTVISTASRYPKAPRISAKVRASTPPAATATSTIATPHGSAHRWKAVPVAAKITPITTVKAPISIRYQRGAGAASPGSADSPVSGCGVVDAPAPDSVVAGSVVAGVVAAGGRRRPSTSASWPPVF